MTRRDVRGSPTSALTDEDPAEHETDAEYLEPGEGVAGDHRPEQHARDGVEQPERPLTTWVAAYEVSPADT